MTETMTRTKQSRSDALRPLHEVAKHLRAVGKATMRGFDLGCTPVKPLTAEAIKHIRQQSHGGPATSPP